MKTALKRFWDWYEKYTEHHVIITTLLFFTQIAHLVWLGLHVIAQRLSGSSLWTPDESFQTLLIIFDYFEIPALVTATLLYISLIRKGEKTRRAWAYIILINVQYLHIFWITDEFVIDTFTGAQMHATILPAWLAWIAILIDYLEVPVIIDTTRRTIQILKARVKKYSTEV